MECKKVLVVSLYNPSIPLVKTLKSDIISQDLVFRRQKRMKSLLEGMDAVSDGVLFTSEEFLRKRRPARLPRKRKIFNSLSSEQQFGVLIVD
ncbi:hypothetical protein AC249_AIPGENE13047 [Exaiptasia diaphana]|nr:hypothetical protein AC249_AIPGENE13047 [Exaiptasia diaphana]